MYRLHKLHQNSFLFILIGLDIVIFFNRINYPHLVYHGGYKRSEGTFKCKDMAADKKNSRSSLHGETLLSFQSEGYPIEVVYYDSFKAPIDIAIASVDELQLLPGIGKATAQAIIEKREANRDKSDTKWLKSIRGISDTKYRAIEPFIVHRIHRAN